MIDLQKAVEGYLVEAARQKLPSPTYSQSGPATAFTVVYLGEGKSSEERLVAEHLNRVRVVFRQAERYSKDGEIEDVYWEPLRVSIENPEGLLAFIEAIQGKSKKRRKGNDQDV